ncbi:MAG: YlmC/YmxH family sporulation protein [Eubacterium sp.]|nr:YlmC/YmxH family sporulation protein [Eubacterium sp.]
MRICDLKEKEVINVCDGTRLGFVEDVEFELCSGRITHIIVPGPCHLLGFFGKEEEYVIELCNICQVGCDLILVEVNLDKVRRKCLL